MEEVRKLNRFNNMAEKLYSKGFRGVVPVMPAAKAGVKGWTTAVDWDIDKIREVGKTSPNHGVGLVCGDGFVAVDVDILDEALSLKARKIIEKHCGPCSYIRIGKYPKFALFYHSKEVPSYKNPYGLPIDIYGNTKGSGLIVVYGQHATTGKDYEWPESDLSSVNCIEDLPAINIQSLNDAMLEISHIEILTSASTLGGVINIGNEGIKVDSAREAYELGKLVDWVGVAEEGTRHHTFMAAMTFLSSSDFVEDREVLIAEVKEVFNRKKPGSEFESNRVIEWTQNNIRERIDKERYEAILDFAKPSPVRFGRRSEEHLYSHGPNCLVDELFYEDVSLMAGPGGSNKTTLVIFEAVLTALGLDIWGKSCNFPIKTLMISAEDDDTTMLAKIKNIMAGMNLSKEDRDRVWQSIGVVYVGSMDFRLCAVRSDVVVINTQRIEELVDWVAQNEFKRVIIDPAVSFGVGEARVNDAEQGLIRAARYIRDQGCMVEYLTHTGKNNARSKTTDQYSSRSGSAFPDGSRLVRVVHAYRSDIVEDVSEWSEKTGNQLEQGSTGVVIHIGKNTWGNNFQPIWVIRNNWSFNQIDVSSNKASIEAKKELEIMSSIYDMISSSETGMCWSELRGMTKEERLADIGVDVSIRSLKRIWDDMTAYGHINISNTGRAYPKTHPDVRNI